MSDFTFLELLAAAFSFGFGASLANRLFSLAADAVSEWRNAQ